MQQRSKAQLFAFLFSMICLMVLQPAATLAQQMLQLGDLSYGNAKSSPVHLRSPVTRHATFFRRVGGVAFEAVAVGVDGLEVRGLRYDPSRPDGQRLAVSVARPGGSPQSVKASIYDWQLIPIARFAEDENGSAMTLFGDLDDKAEQARILQQKGRVINYHAKLFNTLVGLRLFQADILIIQPNAADLFTIGRSYLLGAGESGHNVTRNRERYQQIGKWQQQEQQRGNKYQSYVVGDLDQQVTFSVRQDALSFTGTPYWAAWRPKYGSAQDQARLSEVISSYNSLVDQQRLDRTNAQRAKQIEVLRAEYERLMEVEQMTAYSRELSDRIRALDGVNPIVYRTLTTTMHFRALFKHYQRRDPGGFAAFLKSIENVSISPTVSTPTVQNGT